MRLQMFLIRAN